jgi:hypothetical protein
MVPTSSRLELSSEALWSRSQRSPHCHIARRAIRTLSREPVHAAVGDAGLLEARHAEAPTDFTRRVSQALSARTDV